MMLRLSALLGSLLFLSACEDGSQTEPDAGVGTGVCADADNESA